MKMNLKKIVSFFIILFCFILLIAGFLRSNVSEVKAAPSPVPVGSVIVMGHAWSDTIGWIKFNPFFGGVFYDLTTRKLSGYAWSDTIGWIKFDGLSSYPDSLRGGVAKANTGGFFSGWTRACAGTDTGDCSTMVSRADGWDGWISLSRKPFGTGSDYGVKIDLIQASQTYGDLSGYAWGSDVVGWIKFNCQDTPGECARSNYKVRAILPGAPLEVSCSSNPSSVFLNETTIFTADATGGTNPYSYSWTGDDGLSGASETISKAYSTIGIKNATIEAKDAKGIIKTNKCSVSVAKKLTNPSYNITPSVAVIKVSQTFQFTGIYNSDKTGTSADESDVTNLANWTSSDASIASITTSGITERGLATCLNPSVEGEDIIITSTYIDENNTEFTGIATISCVASNVTVFISADPTSVNEGATTTISWGSENATSCKYLDGGDDGEWKKINEKTTLGSFTTSVFGKTGRTYAIECTDGFSIAKDSVVVNIIEPKNLKVEIVGNGMSLNGAVTSDDKLINCEKDCDKKYDFGFDVTLKASPEIGYFLSEWSGCNSINGNLCYLTMNEGKTVKATFVKEGDITITANDITATIVAGLTTNSYYDKKYTNLSITNSGGNCKNSSFDLIAVSDDKIGDVGVIGSNGIFIPLKERETSNFPYYGNLVVKNILGKTQEKKYPITLTATCFDEIEKKEIGNTTTINLIVKTIFSKWQEI